MRKAQSILYYQDTSISAYLSACMLRLYSDHCIKRLFDPPISEIIHISARIVPLMASQTFCATAIGCKTAMDCNNLQDSAIFCNILQHWFVGWCVTERLYVARIFYRSAWTAMDIAEFSSTATTISHRILIK